MLNIVISLLTFILILISLFMVLVILMQRASSSGGMGSAFGGGVAESAFGTETTNILTRATKWSAVAFFVIALILYLLYMGRNAEQQQPVSTDLLDIVQTEEAVPEADGSELAVPVEDVPVTETGAVEGTGTEEAVAETEEAVDAFAEEATEEPVPPAAP